MSFSNDDSKRMRRALRLAEKGKGYVAPNPLVGCVICSKDGRVIGEGFHERYGKAHAEINALEKVRDPSDLLDATVYVTLEPCSHHGKTPPCAETLGKYPLKRVVVAMKDPNPQVNGNGMAHLKSKGIRVETGLLEDEARRLNEVFIFNTRFGKPYVILKVAQTLDGYVAAPDGGSKWISGDKARKMVHKWRSEYDAVMVGRNTALLDNPKLTVRHVSGRQPKRIVIDGPGTLPDDLHLFSDIHEDKTIRVTYNRSLADNQPDPALSMLQPDYFRGANIAVSEINGHCNLEQAINKIGDMGINSILVEAGSSLASALVRENLVDKLQLFIAPKMLGGGTRSFLGLGIERMSEVIGFREGRWEKFGDDMLYTGYF
ncbi:bifunctional diaminohydroxyphosphoribosylaminopyrimidine deaminase/5-amino-6-(5-phosphoribosylamino)uracil reductase RibD [Natronogracilivirga saccharolytica]|uniref:Riboflavin biosynthesis protein RibD n=1 Tax=Natronogracilivirga saccharolytica TaxID=2812953 RepID=A0A8J7S9E4_9BACT|nr:bifunctional diaminohydroxyphosphoribosylaminopyrimidine deaminase/5-amino-6-(5-phosphoribosylamino)uracil reductase RibD [Natronogracilivirga saccharolytica]MBP3192818.1 bifunctional diaminohydroxyphosphoribosylaminopyrimidine deaminase/5-amino-6-(5-phosphoribosylamino)uracil reductase RibD [Natronogracilivirga saccharolytica]